MFALSQSLKFWIKILALVALTGIAIALALMVSDDIIVNVMLVALILLFWPIGFLIHQHFKGRRAPATASATPSAISQTGAADREAQPDPKEAASNRPSRTYKHLDSGAAEVVDFLRRHRGGAAPGGDAIYSLPWFLIVGPPSSGKSSLMLSAGLSFTALKSQRHSDLDLLRPTGHCDWRVTDHAVLIDSAGRYQTEGADRDEWLGLIETLKRYRQQRPLDGLVVAVNGASLLAKQTTAEVEQQARILRARLNELTAGAGLQFPIYLVFTHIDKVPGFTDFFGALEAEDRSGVWGVTMPLVHKERAHALFDIEFDHLLDSLIERRLPRLSATGAPAEQLGVFDFPILFNTSRQKFGAFTTALFSPNPFSKLPLLRGIYFTSSASGQRGLRSLTAHQTSEGPAARTGELSAQESHIRTKGCFTEGLFKEILRRDGHVAAALQTIHGRPSRIRKLTIAAASLGALSMLLLIGMVVSYFNNRTLIDESKRAGADVLRHFRPVGGAQAEPLSTIEAEDLGKLQDSLLTLDDYNQRWIGPLWHRFGLYTGKRIQPRLREIYFDFASQRLLKPTLAAMAQDLSLKTPAQAIGTRPEQVEAAEQDYYDRLKAYLMVEQQERVEPVFLQQQLSAYWKEGISGTGPRHLYYYVEQASLNRDSDQRVPRPQADKLTVVQARGNLEKYGAPKQIYNEIVSSIGRQGEPYQLREAVGSQLGSQWFEDAGALSVPYVYTKEAYYKHFKGEAWASAFEAIRSKGQNDWVLQRPFDYQRATPEEVRQRYERDYITSWKKFLDGVRVKEFKQKADAVEALDFLAQQNSPLTTIFDQVRNQTTLSEAPVSGGVIAWIKSYVISKEKSTTEVEKSFAALKNFKLETYLEKLSEVRQRLKDLPGDEWRQVAELNTNDRYRKAMDDARSLLKQLASNPGSSSMANLLARPLDNIDVALGRGVTKDRDTTWADLYGIARGLEEKYPFRSSSQQEVQPTDLADYLGRLTQFFDQHLKNSFDRTPGVLRPLRRDEFSDEFVTYLNQMFTLREALGIKGPGEQPRFGYSLKLQPPDGQNVEIRVDGQPPVRAEGGVQTASFNWPSSGQTSGVEIGTVEKNRFRRTGIYPGAWGLFRMVGERGRGNPPYQFNWTGVSITIEPPASRNNPFIDFTRIHAPGRIAR
ncbi:MAG TPA: type VI secretion system membrane subunit TssM [Blastocatellia bacterium]|nr:type VI secretion system membrane subunit TssM [Blastocatellia bacterium]